MAGLLTIWVAVTAALFFLYIAVSFLTPIIAYVRDLVYYFFFVFNVPTDNPFYKMYQSIEPYLANWLGYLTLVSFFGLIVYVVVGAGKREPQEYYV